MVRPLNPAPLAALLLFEELDLLIVPALPIRVLEREMLSLDRRLPIVLSTLLGGDPLLSAAIKGIARRVIERLFGGVHHQVALAVLLCQLERAEGNRDVLFAGAKKAADANDGGAYLAVLVDQQIVDVADLVILVIVDALIVVVADRKRAARQACDRLLIGRRRRRGKSKGYSQQQCHHSG
jgi:hypothetical protein